ncbi:MAG TPA: cytochrome c oxidase subunit II [Bryobacteraceae bacterium]|nr:cytochrome c oxidase subunit II [Bryobacteraceae bacterium]
MALHYRLLGLCLFFAALLGAEPMHAVGNIFKPLATPAELVSDVSILTLVICAGVFLIVASLLTYAVIRFGYREGDSRSEPPQVYGSNQVEIAWTVVPILIVFVLAVATSRITSAVQDHRIPTDAVNVTVIGHQWWWEFRYPDLKIVTANELHVPLSTAVNPRLTSLTLKSADVAHGFWVPQLAGKTDVIPNRTNMMWIDPKEAGIYLGNCSEYCGTQHAKMELRVIVDTPEDFEKWVAQQQAPASANGDDQRLFIRSGCIACHAITGTSARGRLGPDLTHLMSRQTLVGSEVPNTAANLRDWIANPQHLKPGDKMPAMKMSDTQLDRVVAYLTTLH